LDSYWDDSSGVSYFSLGFRNTVEAITVYSEKSVKFFKKNKTANTAPMIPPMKEKTYDIFRTTRL